MRGILAVLAMLALAAPAAADPWKDASGHGRGHHREWWASARER